MINTHNLIVNGLRRLTPAALMMGIALATAFARTSCAGQVLPAPTPYAVVSRDANSAVWQRQTYEQAPDGTSTTSIHRYVELATGLNHLVGGKYVPSTEGITISPDRKST